MAPLITEVNVDTPSVTYRNSFMVRIAATDCDQCFCIINGVQFQLLSDGNGIYWNRIHAIQVGEFSGIFTTYALKTSTGELTSLAGPSVEVSAVSPMMPSEFMRELYLAEGTYNWLGREKVIITDWEARRFDTINFTCVVVKEGKRIRENVSRMHYKNVRCPLVVQVYHTESKEECQKLFEDIMNVEERFLNIPNNMEDAGFNYIKLLDDGKVLPSVNIFSITHSLELVQVLKKVNIDGY